MALVKRDQDTLFDPRNDLRAQWRTRLKFQGKLFNPEKQYEEACLVLDLSPNGAGLKSAYAAAPHSRVILHVDELGRFEGTIVRHDRLYIGVEFKYSKTTRKRIAEKIAIYLEHGTCIHTPVRDRGRFDVADLTHSFALASGQTHACEIVDIALCGLSVKTNTRPAIGERAFFGKTAAVVVRHTEVGFAVEFSHSSMFGQVVAEL